MASTMQAKECRQIEETVWSNKDLFENTASFPVTSADTKSKRINNINGASENVKLHDGTEELIIDGTTPTRSLLAHLIYEDTCLPEAAALSGHITTSGHIPYSGNISLRSDSSTTSTHSFAFPTLQSEWNSSPVKMAKADRRRLRKNRWRTALNCCQF